jgi:DNA modification methylase
MDLNHIYTGDAATVLYSLPDNSIDCVVTSPPYYGLRNYNVDGQIGLEDTPEAYITRLIDVFRQVKRVLKPTGTLWLNIGDSYAGSGRGKGDINKKGVQPKASYASDIFNKPYQLNGYKNKDLMGIPWQLAFALQAGGWYLRQDIIWHKPNPMPESIRDRCTKAHEYIFLLTKSARYYFDHKAIMELAKYDGRKDTRMKGSHKYSQEGNTGLTLQTFAARGHERWTRNENGEFMRNKRSVWTVCTRPYKGAHFATYPEALIIDCIKAGCPPSGIVLDPFFGAGTTGLVARNIGRNYVGIELNPEYVKIAQQRLWAWGIDKATTSR